MDTNVEGLFPADFTPTLLVEKMRRKKRLAQLRDLVDLAVELTKLTIKERWEYAERSIYGSTEDPLDRESLEATAEIVVQELVRRGFKAEVGRRFSDTYIGTSGKHRSSHTLKVYNPVPSDAADKSVTIGNKQV